MGAVVVPGIGENGLIRRTIVDVVHQIEEFGAKLQADVLRHRDVLEHRKIHFRQPGPGIRAAAHIAVRSGAGKMNAFGLNHWFGFPVTTGPVNAEFS